ncbi:MAG: TlpA family protein disulfide reductase [Bradyrhizobium sp.]|nr:TlpA family protein disulfide reductase [Bradyrhizobium sp.]
MPVPVHCVSTRRFAIFAGALHLNSLRGKLALINFWASWCVVCRTELPFLERQYESAWRGYLV